MHCRHYWSDGQIEAYAKQYLRRSDDQDPEELPEVSGFAFFIRRKIWEANNGFAECLDDYGNEAELCGRLAKQGYKFLWVKQSYIHHFGEQSYSQLGEGYIQRRKAEIHKLFADQ
jgi:GT2 family glycosyltransferase